MSTTVLNPRSTGFVSTPSIESVTQRAFRYLQSGFAVHLRGPAGCGKTTLAMHLAYLLNNPLMLIFGDDQFTSSDLIGNNTGYSRKKVVDNYIHSVVKLEDQVQQNWVDSRLTLACREGLTLVYDDFNRSRPEANNVLLAALEEKLLALPINNGNTNYVKVHPNFRAIFTSNPEEYSGIHSTQDALADRMITINMPEPDELTMLEIMVQKLEISREDAGLIVEIVRNFRQRTQSENSSSLRSCIMIAKICKEHNLTIVADNDEFRQLCGDVLLSKVGIPYPESSTILWGLFNELMLVNMVKPQGNLAPHNGQPKQGNSTAKMGQPRR
jgi:gas vesicle protein GvpN